MSQTALLMTCWGRWKDVNSNSRREHFPWKPGDWHKVSRNPEGWSPSSQGWLSLKPMQNVFWTFRNVSGAFRNLSRVFRNVSRIFKNVSGAFRNISGAFVGLALSDLDTNPMSDPESFCYYNISYIQNSPWIQSLRMVFWPSLTLQIISNEAQILLLEAPPLEASPGCPQWKFLQESP